MGNGKVRRLEREAQREAKTVPLANWAEDKHGALYVTRKELLQIVAIFDRELEKRLVERFDELEAQRQQALAESRPLARLGRLLVRLWRWPVATKAGA